MSDIGKVYGKIVLELLFPKERTISALVCDASISEIGAALYKSFQTPCNPYAEVVRGLVSLETETRPQHTTARRDEHQYSFLQIDYVKRWFKYGDGPDYYNMKCYVFSEIRG